MASIENRGELQWRAVVRKKGFPRYTRTFERHRDAQGWATDLEAAIGRRDLAEVRRLTDDAGGNLRTLHAVAGPLPKPALADTCQAYRSDGEALKAIWPLHRRAA